MQTVGQLVHFLIPSFVIVLLALLVSCREGVADTFKPPRGLIPADSKAIESIYQSHRKAQLDVAGRLGADPDVRKLVCASTSLAGFVSKNASLHLTPTLKTRSSLAAFKDAGVPIYDTCQVWTRNLASMASLTNHDTVSRRQTGVPEAQ